jgi:hypothetical protein
VSSYLDDEVHDAAVKEGLEHGLVAPMVEVA